jgi:allantoin racemase
MTMRLHVVTPVTRTKTIDRTSLAAGLGPDITVTHSQIQAGPASIESEFDEALAVPATLAEVRAAAGSGARAVVIDCMGDPGLQAAREVVDVPVLGSGQTSMHLAAMLGHKFSILTVLDRLVHIDEEKVARYGLSARLASVRSADIPVLGLDSDKDRLIVALTRQALRAVRDDGAHVLILGCTGMLGLAAHLACALADGDVHDVPVIDPLPATLQVAAALARSGLSHSKHTYPYPPVKDRPGYADHDASAPPAPATVIPVAHAAAVNDRKKGPIHTSPQR